MRVGGTEKEKRKIAETEGKKGVERASIGKGYLVAGVSFFSHAHAFFLWFGCEYGYGYDYDYDTLG